MCRERRHFIHALLGGRTASHSRRLCLRFGVVAAVLSLAVFMTPARADFFKRDRRRYRHLRVCIGLTVAGRLQQRRPARCWGRLPHHAE